ncbi:polyprenyl synthetase family protein [Ligilactobacillus sp. WILCCON 0076]|uniref:Farnesyl diphosphate synthase n=1 Tax=Ligilactobacillus ubinensis TaxID=2876789 RepID=A0A9X2JKS8_9LACO|nr:farnesyl diphosphate synthase [Ligilactobacillus ubinensis]MCP0886422.1 polyprenyl synthetase family protein [Ligilactobacillus ubinensis]
MKTNKQNLQAFEELYRPQIDQVLVDYLNSLKSNASLKKAMLYSVLAGGKRIRPILMLAVLASLRDSINKSEIEVAASLELIHTYSLIHDDLPEMDNDDLRRGKPTNHKVFGQALAVLAGDGLLTSAFEWLSQVKIDNQIKIELLHELAYAAGPQGMVNGQVGDILGEKQQLTLAQLQEVHRGKTGALLRYACKAGALMGAADDKISELLCLYGENFGLAFQIYDDILDVVSTEKEMGKAVHKDTSENKNTYPELLGLNKAYSKLEQTILAAKKNLADLEAEGIKTDLLLELLDYFEIKEPR